jgi:hypothetical protein
MKKLIINKNKYIINYEKDTLYYNDKIYLLYDAKVINIPFFKKIKLLKTNITLDDLKMIYNMLLVNGYIFFKKKHISYLSFFSNRDIIERGNFYIFQKKNNFQYIIEYTRTVEFIILGTQKGGTTALAKNISNHPDIYIDKDDDPRKSEIHFFDINWKRGIDFYKKKFNYSKKMVGEKTPDLLYLTYTFPLIQSVNPYIKIIILLRNPIYRAYSSWKLVKKYFGESRTFEKAINDELQYKLKENKTFFTAMTHYLQRGLYYKQIKELYKWFPKQNILILISENVKNNMEKYYNQVYEFLNLNTITTKYNLIFESDDKTEIDVDLYNKLKEFYLDDYKKLCKLLKINPKWF